MHFLRIHQIQVAACAALILVSAAYSLFASEYYFSSGEAVKASISRIVVHFYLLVVSVALLFASLFGSRVPHLWLSLLDSYKGTGFFMIFLGFYVLNISDWFGQVTAVITISVGVASIVFSFIEPDADKQDDSSFLG